MATVVTLRDGRTWSDDGTGATGLQRRYRVILDAPLAADGEALFIKSLVDAGLIPAVGSAHPNDGALAVQKYEVREGESSAKHLVELVAHYERVVVGSARAGFSDSESAEEDTCAVTEWGWDSSTGQRELTTAADGKAVLNSCGDAFDRVPTVAVFTPTFTKVMKFKTRQAGVQAYNCKVNQSEIRIGGMTCGVASLLCAVAEKRIFGEKGGWKYQYTVNLRYMSNPVAFIDGSEGNVEDVGWDAAVVDTGMREWKDGKLVLIQQRSGEGGVFRPVTSPELLDGSGHAVTRSSSGSPSPYVFRFQAYKRVNFPEWFYSEPD